MIPKSLAAESPADELTADQVIDALQGALVVSSKQPDYHFTVRSISARRFMSQVIVYVRFTDGSSGQVRIAVDRVREVRDRLTTVIDR